MQALGLCHILKQQLYYQTTQVTGIYLKLQRQQRFGAECQATCLHEIVLYYAPSA